IGSRRDFGDGRNSNGTCLRPCFIRGSRFSHCLRVRSLKFRLHPVPPAYILRFGCVSAPISAPEAEIAMSLVVTCPKCASKLSIPDAAAGKKLRCPRCQEVFLPDEKQPPAALSTQVTAQPPPLTPAPTPPPPATPPRTIDEYDEPRRP